MKIAILNPPSVYFKGERPFLTFPLGLGYLAAVLQEENAEFCVIDSQGEDFSKKTFHEKVYYGLSFSRIRKRLIEARPDLLLIGCAYTIQEEMVLRLSRMAKEATGCLVMLGGNPVTAEPYLFLSSDTVDFIVMGEGELPLRMFVRNFPKVQHIPGLGYKRRGSIVINARGEAPDIDSLPLPARTHFPYQNYLSSRYRHTMLHTRKKAAEMITSRGCPSACSFCASGIVAGNHWRPRKLSSVLDEASRLVEMGAEEIHLEDDNLLVDRDRFVSLCRGLKSVGVTWAAPNGIQLSLLDDDLLDVMKESGCHTLFLPIETFTKRMRQHADKPILDDTIQRIVRAARRKGFYLVGFFMLGFYDERKSEVMETIKQASRLGLDEAHFSIVTPYPGTVYWKLFHGEKTSPKHPSGGTRHLSSREITRLRNAAYIIFEIGKIIDRPLSYLSISQLRRLTRYLKQVPYAWN